MMNKREGKAKAILQLKLRKAFEECVASGVEELDALTWATDVADEWYGRFDELIGDDEDEADELEEDAPCEICGLLSSEHTSWASAECDKKRKEIADNKPKEGSEEDLRDMLANTLDSFMVVNELDTKTVLEMAVEVSGAWCVSLAAIVEAEDFAKGTTPTKTKKPADEDEDPAELKRIRASADRHFETGASSGNRTRLTVSVCDVCRMPVARCECPED